jgi:pre-peptidase/leishmanolysin/CARDB protein
MLRRFAPFLLVGSALLVSSCGGEKGPSEPSVPTPTSISLLPLTASLDALGDTIRFSALVKDQNGRGISAVVSYASSDPGVVSVGTVGDATAVSNGVAQITASAGAASATATVTVAQAAAAINLLGGDGQSGLVGKPLSQAIRFSVEDRLGAPIPGLEVTFQVPAGAGTITPSPTTVDEFGNFEVTWTLGPDFGLHEVIATVGGESVTFWANALGLPDLSVSSIVTSPATPTAGQTVDFLITVANGGADVNLEDVPIQVTVDGQEVDLFQSGPIQGESSATFRRADLGPFTAGNRAIQVVIDQANTLEEVSDDNNVGNAAFEVVTATAIESGVAVASLAGAMGSQSFFTIEVAPSAGQKATALEVALTGGSGNADLYVRADGQPTTAVFDCSSLGGTSTESCLINDPAPGTYHVLIQGGAAFADVSLQGTVAEEVGPQGTFNIELIYLNGATDAQRAAFEAARVRWEAAINADVPDNNFGAQPFPENVCTRGQRRVIDVLDDVRIYVNLVPIDGRFGVLGSAGPCAIRDDSALPLLGSMDFDTADLDFLAESGRLTTVILHEMGHVLGIGTIWDHQELLVNPSLPDNSGADTHFPGALAIAAFDEAGGDTYVGGAKVPVENEAGQGSGDSHWRESVLGNELMTPTINSGQNPMSAISIASLGDLGYSVDTSGADAYARPGSSGVSASDDLTIHLGNDIRPGPIFIVDRRGRILRVIR